MRSIDPRPLLLPSLLLTLAACTGGAPVPPSVAPDGRPESTRTDLLEAGATALQTDAPVDAMDIYLVGFHPMKDDPGHQMEAHHFCRQVNEDFAQCALFDGNTADANLNGLEYIISERLFEQLPQEERQYWHPHNGEILSGQLVAPNLPEVAEHELMEAKMNSYGKTWHTWRSEHGTGPGDQIPLGPPMLAWSFNRDGEARPELIEARDQDMGISTSERRAARQDLVPLAQPQEGVDALQGAFPRPTTAIPGVVDKNDAAR
ncbi:OBAP family protein [Geminicoccus roseus]|uniref:OBAP family protein n=1 Tax=Geminicoccus roseus TaxID=404900 RepID=UPI0003F90C86|nr:OBAP family protein [Geminicoccus roseus]